MGLRRRRCRGVAWGCTRRGGRLVPVAIPVTVTIAAACAALAAVTIRTVAAFATFAALTALTAFTAFAAISSTFATAAITMPFPVGSIAPASAATAILTITIRRAARVGLFTGGRLRIAEQPTPDAYKDSCARTTWLRSHRDRWRGRRCGGLHHDRCRRRGQEGRHGSRLLSCLLFARTGGVWDLGRRRQLVAELFLLRQFSFIVAHAADGIFRRVDVEVRHDDQLDVALVLERAQPFAFFVDQVGRHIHRHFGDDLGGAILAYLLADETQDGKRHRLDGADAANALTARAHLVTGITQRGTQALTRHLEQTEARQATNLDARTVRLHGVTQSILDGSLVAAFFHVDEVDDDQTADVADAQLACDLICRFEVGVGGGGFNVTAARGARRVDVDGHQRFGVVDNDRAARRQLHLVSVSRLDLAFDLVAREQRDIVRVHLQATAAFGRHEALHVLRRDAVCVRLIDEHLADVLGEVVAQGARDRIAFTVDEERRRTRQHGLDDFVPLDLQVIEVPLQFLDCATDPGRAHDGAHTLRYGQRIHDVAHLVSIFALDPPADAARPRVIRHQHEEAPGERNIGGEGGALVAALFLFDLHDDVLAFLQDFAHVDAAARGLLQEVLARDFFQRQEAVALGAVIDEAGFERGLDARDARFVDVCFLLFAGG